MSRFSRHPYLLKHSQSENHSELEVGAGRERTESDAERLYFVADTVYMVLTVFNCIIGVGGILLAFIGFFGSASAGFGFAVLCATGVICSVIYAFSVLSTHVAKVLSNISLSLLGESKANQ